MSTQPQTPADPAGKRGASKRAARYQEWLNPPGVPFATTQAEQAYKNRVQGIIQ